MSQKRLAQPNKLFREVAIKLIWVDIGMEPNDFWDSQIGCLGQRVWYLFLRIVPDGWLKQVIILMNCLRTKETKGADWKGLSQ